MSLKTRSWMKKKVLSNMGSPLSWKSKCFVGWTKLFLHGTDYDRWDKKDQAISTYERLIEEIENFLATGATEANGFVEISLTQRETASKVALCLKSRVNALKVESTTTFLSLHNLMDIKPVLKDFYGWNGLFPILIHEQPSSSTVSLLSEDSGLDELTSSDDEETCGEQLLPRLHKKTGCSRMSIKIQQIGLKDVTCLENPYITISVRDSDSVNLTPLQNTPSCTETIDNFHLSINTKVEIQRYIEKMPKGTAIFFELKVRTKKGRMKTKCFAFLSKEMFHHGKFYLELFKGPTDYHRINLHRLTAKKPLFLHIDVNLLDAKK